MSMSNIEFNQPTSCDALVSFTLLSNADEFIQQKELSVKCLFDLSSLVESIILHPRIVTIKGIIPEEKYPHKIIDFLTNNKLIYFYKPTYSTRELLTMMNQYALFRNLSWYGFSWDIQPFWNRKRPVLESEELLDNCFGNTDPSKSTLERILEASNSERFSDLEIDSFVSRLKSKNNKVPEDYNLFDIIHCMSTGSDRIFREYLFRSIVYLCSADYDKLTFYDKERRWSLHHFISQ